MPEVPLIPECNPTQTLDTAHALQFQLAPADPRRSVIVWRDGVKPLRPVMNRRLRDLRPGDLAIYRGRQETIQAVEVYR